MEPRETKNNEAILHRIIQDSENPELFQTLLRIPNTDYQSLVLELSEEKSSKIGKGELNKVLEENPFVQTSAVEQKVFTEFDSFAYNLLPSKYMSVELSPLVPFATNKILAGISQKRIFSVTRNAEIVSDPTTALALYCARERILKLSQNSRNADPVSLASSHRVIRQENVKKAEYSSHFRTFALAVAGRDIGHEAFEKENVREQLFFFLNLLKVLNEFGGYSINKMEINIANADNSHKELLDILNDSVFENLKQSFPEVDFYFDPYANSDYYKSIFYRITGFNQKGEGPISIAGGGITDWTEILVSSKKERLLVGAIGTEILCKHFKN